MLAALDDTLDEQQRARLQVGIAELRDDLADELDDEVSVASLAPADPSCSASL